jgi:hypothetical protein
VRSSLALPGGEGVPVVLVSAKSGLGVPELWQAVTSVPRRGKAGKREDLLPLAQVALSARFAAAGAARGAELDRVAQQWQQGLLSREEVGDAVLRLLDGLAAFDPR